MNATVTAGILLASSAIAQAQSPRSDDQYSFKFTPGAWVTRLQGTSSLGPSPVAGDISAHRELKLNDHEAALTADFTVEKNREWFLNLNGFHFSTDSSALAINPMTFGALTLAAGDPFIASFDMTSVAAEFGWWLFEPIRREPSPDGRENRLSLQVGVVAGARYINLDQSLSAVGIAEQSAGGDWLAPYAGGQMRFVYDTPDTWPMLDAIEVRGGFNAGPAIGTDDVGLLVQIHAGIAFMFSPHFGAGLEYRLIELDVAHDAYEFEGGLQGIFFFATLRF